MDQLLEKTQNLVMLYDLYNPLLTDKQREYFEMYYFDDFSLAEIADNLTISRNAVFDALKKVNNILEEYESKLHLYEKGQKQEAALKELRKYTDPKGLAIIEKLEKE
jgi:predicted DNA-binding protein YlxM (UPF0122 family)